MADVRIDINVNDKASPVIANLQQKLQNLQKNANINISGGTSKAGGMGSLIKGFTLGSLAADAATESLSRLKEAAQDAIEKFMQLQTIQRTFAFAVSNNVTDLAKVAGEVERLKIADFAKEYGFSIMETTDQFAKFAAATKGTNISLKESEIIFRGTTKAAAAYGLKQDQVSRIYKAYIDIISKGKPQAEEVVRQFGNNMPGGLNLLSQSLGITTGEFRKLMKEGKLTSEILVDLGKYMDKTFDISSKERVSSLSGRLENLKNAFDSLKLTLAEGFGPLFIKIIERIEQSISDAQKLANFVFGESIRTSSARELKENFQNTALGKELESAENIKDDQKRKKALNKLAEKTQTEYFTQLRSMTGDIKKAVLTDYEPSPFIPDVIEKSQIGKEAFKSSELRKSFEKYLTPSTKELISKFKESRDVGDETKMLDAIISDLSNLPEGGLGKRSKAPFGDLVRQLTIKKGALEMIQKAAVDTTGITPPSEEESNATKLKTDYHTPKIININILTGEGASMINGGVQTTIETNTVDSKDVKDNIVNVLNEQLNMILNDTGSAILRTINSAQR